MRSKLNGQVYAQSVLTYFSRYIFRPQLSVDANFRLSCKMRPSPRTDEPLYSGQGVQPSFEEYHAWLRTYVTEEEVLFSGSF